MRKSYALGCLMLAPFCLSPALQAEDDHEAARLANLVYVNSNNPTPNRNAILAYHRDPVTGQLTELHGSPFQTGGTGFYNNNERLGPDDHDQELALSADRRFMYAVNQGSDTIAAFRIDEDGSLSPVPGSPFSSGGVQPASLGVDGLGLFVVNRGDQNPGGGGGSHAPSYIGFFILPNGALLRLPWSQLSLVPGSSPTQALFSPDGKVMFDSHLFEDPFNNAGFPPFIPAASSELHSYRVSVFGQLTPAAHVVPPAPIPPFILGLQVHPRQKVLYVGYVVAGVLGAYTYDDNGNMTLSSTVAGSPNNGMCWIAVSADGKYAYTSGAVTDHIDVFSLADAAHPVFIQTVDLKGPRGLVNFPIDATVFNTTPFQLHTSPDGKFLYVLNHETTIPNDFPNGNAIHILQIDSAGKATEIASSPFIFPVGEVPANGHPLGILVF